MGVFKLSIIDLQKLVAKGLYKSPRSQNTKGKNAPASKKQVLRLEAKISIPMMLVLA